MICEDCKEEYEMWMTTNEEWNNVIENTYLNLCIDCFKEKSKEGNIIIDLSKIKIYNKDNIF
jgi:hypothetical protein